MAYDVLKYYLGSGKNPTVHRTTLASGSHGSASPVWGHECQH